MAGASSDESGTPRMQAERSDGDDLVARFRPFGASFDMVARRDVFASRFLNQTGEHDLVDA